MPPELVPSVAVALEHAVVALEHAVVGLEPSESVPSAPQQEQPCELVPSDCLPMVPSPYQLVFEPCVVGRKTVVVGSLVIFVDVAVFDL